MIVIETELARAAARSIAEDVLGSDLGRLTQDPSASHQVFVGPTVVVKVIDATEHSRLDREVALATDLPIGLLAPILASGRCAIDGRDIRYACLARVPGTSPGMGLVGVDWVTAHQRACQAIRHLQRLHAWVPTSAAAAVLREPLEHGGFTGRSQFLTEIEAVRALDEEQIVQPRVIDGLVEMAESAPQYAEAVIPVHADCHWGNWLVHEARVSALLDFEWARFGHPSDDWMFLSRFSGPPMHSVLSVIADLAGTPLDTLRAACEVREAAYILSDLLLKLQAPHGLNPPAARNIRELEDIVIARSWWR